MIKSNKKVLLGHLTVELSSRHQGRNNKHCITYRLVQNGYNKSAISYKIRHYVTAFKPEGLYRSKKERENERTREEKNKTLSTILGQEKRINGT